MVCKHGSGVFQKKQRPTQRVSNRTKLLKRLDLEALAERLSGSVPTDRLREEGMVVLPSSVQSAALQWLTSEDYMRFNFTARRHTVLQSFMKLSFERDSSLQQLYSWLPWFQLEKKTRTIIQIMVVLSRSHLDFWLFLKTFDLSSKLAHHKDKTPNED